MRPRILIFEDNDILRSTLKYILTERGYEVFSFSDPRMCRVYNSFYHKCSEDYACADIVISDVKMSTKTGLELIKERQQKGCKAKYRALMSGDWSDSDLIEAQELGCTIFRKPFDIKELFQWLEGCIKKINPERKLSDLLEEPD